MKTLFETKANQGSTIKHSNTVHAAKQRLLEPLSATVMTVTTRSKRLLHFDPDSNLVTQGCLPAKGFVEAFRNRPFFIPVVNTSTKQQHSDRHKVLGCLNDDIFP